MLLAALTIIKDIGMVDMPTRFLREAGYPRNDQARGKQQDTNRRNKRRQNYRTCRKQEKRGCYLPGRISKSR